MGSLADEVIGWLGVLSTIFFSVNLLGMELNGEAGVNDGITEGEELYFPLVCSLKSYTPELGIQGIY